MISPADIDSKQFAVTRLKEGYNQAEVDDYLDRVAKDYSELYVKWQRLEVESARLQRVVDARGSEAPTSVLPLTPTGSAERILVAAQRTADAVEAEANAEAGQIRAAARAEAAGLKSAAETERQQILGELGGQAAELEEKIEGLKARRTQYKSWLKAAIIKMEEEESG